MYTAKARTQNESIWNKLAKQNTQTEDRNKYDGGRNDTARNVVIPKGKRPLDRTRSRRKYNFKADLKEIRSKIVNWI